MKQTKPVGPSVLSIAKPLPLNKHSTNVSMDNKDDDSIPEPAERKPLFDTTTSFLSSLSNNNKQIKKKKSSLSTSSSVPSSTAAAVSTVLPKEDVLPISSSFAAALEAKGKLTSRQRKEAALNGVTLSSGAVRAFLRAVTPVLEETASVQVQPADILQFIRNRHKFNYEKDVPEVVKKYGYGNNFSNDATMVPKGESFTSSKNKLSNSSVVGNTTTIEELAQLTPIRRAERDLMKWALATSYRQKHGIDKHGKVVTKDTATNASTNLSQPQPSTIPSVVFSSSSLSSSTTMGSMHSTNNPSLSRKRSRESNEIFPAENFPFVSPTSTTITEPKYKFTENSSIKKSRVENTSPLKKHDKPSKVKPQSIRREKDTNIDRSDYVSADKMAVSPNPSKRIPTIIIPPAIVDNTVRVHGRGAGKNRNLDHHGEPKYQDMHPSWQTKRKLYRHQTKAVTKALRKGTGAIEEIITIKA